VSGTHREQLYALCEGIGRLSTEIMEQCELVVTPLGMTEPRILVLALLSRSLNNLKGVVALTKTRLVVEARVLARCCYENMYMVGGLHAEGAAFAKRMVDDNEAGRKGRIRFTFENEQIFGTLSAEMQESVKERHELFKAMPKFDFLQPKQASGVSAFKETYIVYSQFSGDAAHPTLMALSRHWGPADDKTAYFDVAPEPREDELDETLHLACMAVMGIMVVVNEMHRYTEAGKKLPSLNGALQALQEAKWGPATINEGMEFRTEKPPDAS